MTITIGTRFGPYEITGSLGAGGMGEVYRARDPRLKRDVAIKVLPEVVAMDADRRARFEREAQVLASLQHPHIASIFGLEQAHGVSALVLELVDGPTLAESLRRGPLPVAEAVRAAHDIASALEAAHDKGVIHRDLKPANVKLTTDGGVKVLDFGLAKVLDPVDAADVTADCHLSVSPTVSIAGTQAGVILGTAAYMSPEQARGRPLDVRTDIWSFGCVLFEMLTGQRAFGGDTVTDILSAVVSREPDWTRLPAHTSDVVHRVLRKCLAKDLKRRLRHIGDARLELENGTIDPSLVSQPPRHRERLAWSLAGVLALALAASLGGALGRSPALDDREPVVSRVVQLTSGPAHDSAPAISPDGKWVAYLSNARGVTDVWVKYLNGGDPVNLTASANLALQSQSDNGGLAISPDGASIAFDAGVSQLGPPSFSAWVIAAPLGGVPRKLLASGRAVRWSPDGTKIVYVSAGGSAGDALWVADADGSNPREIAPRRSGIHKHWPAWSSDGRYIYYNSTLSSANAEPAELYRVPVDGGPIEPVVTTARRAVFPLLMPNGRGLIYAANPDTAELSVWWRSFGGNPAPPTRLINGVGEYAELNLSADGRNIVSTLVEIRQELVRLSATSARDKPGDPTVLTSGHTGDLDPTLSPGGDRLVFSSTRSGNRNLWTSRPDGGDARPLTSGTWLDERPSFSPDGARVAFVSDRGGRRGIWAMNADGGAPRLLAIAEVLDTISWSRDGSRIVFAAAGDQSGLRTVALSDGSVQVLRTPGPAAQPAWSPREDVIAYLENMPSSPGTPITLHIRFVDASGQSVFEPIPGPSAGNGALAWNTDGTRLAAYGNSGLVASAVWIVEPEGRQPLRPLATFASDIRLRGLTWTPDGESLIIGQQRRTGDIVLFELTAPDVVPK